MDTAYLSLIIQPNDEAWRAYLYGYATVLGSVTQGDRRSVLIEIRSTDPTYHAQYQSDRLASGLYPAPPFPTVELAVEHTAAALGETTGRIWSALVAELRQANLDLSNETD